MTVMNVVQGAKRVSLDPKFIGNPKDMKRIEEARKMIESSILLEPNLASEADDLLEQGLILYEDLFPNPNERESDELIRKRLSSALFCRSTKGCFDILLNTNAEGKVISWHQFSTLPLGSGSAIAYMQYTGCASDTFMEKMYGKKAALHGHGIYTYNIALMQQIADQRARETLQCSQGVKGYILESEMIGQALTDEEIRYTRNRLLIHERTGAKAIMFRMPDGSLLTPHYQPALGKDSEATKLLILYRTVQYDSSRNQSIELMEKSSAYDVLMAFIDNFDKEEFDEREVEQGRKYIRRWFESAAEAVLVPPTQTPDIVEMSKSDELLRSFVLRDFGDTDLQAQRISHAFRAE